MNLDTVNMVSGNWKFLHAPGQSEKIDFVYYSRWGHWPQTSETSWEMFLWRRASLNLLPLEHYTPIEISFFQNITSFFYISRDLTCIKCFLAKNDPSVTVRFKVLIARLSTLSLQIIHVLWHPSMTCMVQALNPSCNVTEMPNLQKAISVTGSVDSLLWFWSVWNYLLKQ